MIWALEYLVCVAVRLVSVVTVAGQTVPEMIWV